MSLRTLTAFLVAIAISLTTQTAFSAPNTAFEIPIPDDYKSLLVYVLP